MIVCHGDNTTAEHDCDVWPTDLTYDRAHQLRHLHDDRVQSRCAVRFAVISALTGVNATSAMTAWISSEDRARTASASLHRQVFGTTAYRRGQIAL